MNEIENSSPFYTAKEEYEAGYDDSTKKTLPDVHSADEESPFYTAKEEYEAGYNDFAKKMISAQNASAAHELAFIDKNFLLREELRPVRLQLELLKPDLIQKDEGIDSTVVIFGGARILDRKHAKKRLELAEKVAEEYPHDAHAARDVRIAKSLYEKSHYYEEAKKLGSLISQEWQKDDKCSFVVLTGGGPGIMEAANLGAYAVGAKSLGFSMVLPNEEMPNIYMSPSLCFQFHYFAIRKMHFLIRAKALVVFPGGFGTLDELFEVLTLMATKKIQLIPLLLFGKNYWNKIINFEAMAEEGVIGWDDLNLFRYVETAEDAFRAIKDFYPEA
jgi:uncharacterized protein (TIGR00730 family)